MTSITTFAAFVVTGLSPIMNIQVSNGGMLWLDSFLRLFAGCVFLTRSFSLLSGLRNFCVHSGRGEFFAVLLRHSCVNHVGAHGAMLHEKVHLLLLLRWWEYWWRGWSNADQEQQGQQDQQDQQGQQRHQQHHCSNSPRQTNREIAGGKTTLPCLEAGGVVVPPPRVALGHSLAVGGGCNGLGSDGWFWFAGIVAGKCYCHCDNNFYY